MTGTDAYIHRRLPGRPGGRLLAAFHGTGGDENQFVDLGRELMRDATILSPRGDVSEYGAARFFRRMAEGVYDMDDLKRATAKTVAFVRAHVEDVGATAADGFGYSNGANILASALFAAPDLFERVALLHPLIPFEPTVEGSLNGRRVLITAGRRDPICPPHLTARLEAHLRDKGADVMVVWHEGGHEIRAGEIEAMRTFLAPDDVRTASALPEIVREETGSKGRYVIRLESGEEAEMTFTRVGDAKVIIDHTGAPDAFRGKGAGAALVAKAVADFRAAGVKVIPLCPFAAAQFRRHPEWADVLDGRG